MKTLILNGSPKGATGNTHLFIEQFNAGMTSPCEVRLICKEDPRTLAQALRAFDTILIVMPLYIHPMPAIVQKLFEQMQPCETSDKSIGFLIQFGFAERSMSQYLERYLPSLARRLHYTYLGTVVKSNAAGVCMMPRFFSRKLFRRLRALGKAYEQSGTFDPAMAKAIAKPEQLSRFTLKLLLSPRLQRLNDFTWNAMLKSNDALENCYDRPFADVPNEP